jgi:hypothetical protein
MRIAVEAVAEKPPLFAVAAPSAATGAGLRLL